MPLTISWIEVVWVALATCGFIESTLAVYELRVALRCVEHDGNDTGEKIVLTADIGAHAFYACTHTAALLAGVMAMTIPPTTNVPLSIQRTFILFALIGIEVITLTAGLWLRYRRRILWHYINSLLS